MAEAEKRAEDERLVAAEERERVREDREFNQRLYNMFYPVCVCVCVCACVRGRVSAGFHSSFLFCLCPVRTRIHAYTSQIHTLSRSPTRTRSFYQEPKSQPCSCHPYPPAHPVSQNGTERSSQSHSASPPSLKSHVVVTRLKQTPLLPHISRHVVVSRLEQTPLPPHSYHQAIPFRPKEEKAEAKMLQAAIGNDFGVA